MSVINRLRCSPVINSQGNAIFIIILSIAFAGLMVVITQYVMVANSNLNNRYLQTSITKIERKLRTLIKNDADFIRTLNINAQENNAHIYGCIFETNPALQNQNIEPRGPDNEPNQESSLDRIECTTAQPIGGSTPPTETAGPLVLYEPGTNNFYYDNRTPNHGFTFAGELCDEFNSDEGSDACPIQVSVTSALMCRSTGTNVCGIRFIRYFVRYNYRPASAELLRYSIGTSTIDTIDRGAIGNFSEASCGELGMWDEILRQCVMRASHIDCRVEGGRSQVISINRRTGNLTCVDYE